MKPVFPGSSLLWAAKASAHLARLAVRAGKLKTAANGKAKEAHKRQISQAIPRNERDNGELSPPEAALANSRYTQGSTQEGIQEGTRKSVRAQAKNAQLE